MKKFSSNRGFTLIEWMLTLMLLAILIAILISIYQEIPISPKTIQLNQDIASIQNGMKFYKLDQGNYPTTEQGIAALVTKPTTHPIPAHWKPYLTSIPSDPAGGTYQYCYSSQHQRIYIYSERPRWKQWLKYHWLCQ